MYVQEIDIDLGSCNANVTNCNICVLRAPTVFAIDHATRQAKVIAATPLTLASDEEAAGYAIQTCPTGAIWGRGEGEAIGEPH